MIVKRTSIISGRESEMDLPVTQEQIERWSGGELIQRVFPDLTSDQREFLISGITPEEWNSIYS